MNISIGIGCPLRQVGLANIALKFSLLLLALVFFCERLHAQCDGVWRRLDDFIVASSSHFVNAEQKTLLIDLEVSGTTNASEIILALESEMELPPIDSMQLEWVGSGVRALPSQQLIWSQNDNSKRLNLDLVIDQCRPIFANAFRFRLKVFCPSIPMDEWRVSTVLGGLVQVDVIQAKMAAFETQHFYALDGTLIRVVERPAKSAPATEGLISGIYLLRRVQEGVADRYEKVLVQ